MKNRKLCVIYRISDKGNLKDKISYATKEYCLKNALKEFGKENFYVIADNCSFETLELLSELEINFEKTTLGNIKSFLYVISFAIEKYLPEDYVYFLEDDYVHLPKSKKILLEGLEIADYVTLYDHPDKYVLLKKGGNPFNCKDVQSCKMYVTQSGHWRTTNSTTMSFAVQIKTLKEDISIWLKQPQRGVTNSFSTFVNLTHSGNLIDAIRLLRTNKRAALAIFKHYFSLKKSRRLISSIPAKATHAEKAYLSPIIEWER